VNEQQCFSSSEFGLIAEHGVEGYQHFPHDGDEGQLVGFPPGAEALVVPGKAGRSAQ
jgi:hypothetical protein